MKNTILALLFALPLFTLAQKNNFEVKKSFPIKSSGGWDYITV
jgi:hypothetical protein